ncbi:toll/interleukin-1 receptor domain-containing protein [Brevibacillus parabrevis]|uniref:toll/interleukin-1 receptor domain-containing protein n=1 Tax=Brevibacillus parabrevis TaxID=54914 RepID=UPI001C24B8DB|nr:toll/interleukin-1 receptor domain-containing protein [Brevibacillus parabrevis]MBU8715250.1 toll/interleukin-1 receptor domain-containing protein [Brevibacillus parabrevis]
MFAGFNLKMGSDLSQYKELGKSIFNNCKKQVEEEIDKFLLDDGSINGTEMQSNWFPQINADIFISHSHADRETAIALAGWLKYTFNLDVFIDSCVWGYADELLKKIDDRFCKNPDGSAYIYEKRNHSTSHVHMMLSTALTMLIDKTECIFILNTPNSIQSSEIINETKSPWIYYEIGITRLVRKTEPKRPSGILKKGLFENAQNLTVKYKVDMEHLCEITKEDLDYWKKIQEQSRDQHPLDLLYNIHKLIEVPNLMQSTK